MTTLLCFVAALVEGFDLQSTGVAGPGIRADFHLDAAQMGLMFSASLIGLLPGAALGGRLADIVGRKKVLIWSMVLFGIFSIVTTRSWDYSTLLLARFLTGMGLGGAMPNLIALSSESASPRARNIAISIMYAGMPLGGSLAAVISYAGIATGAWHAIFYVGGFAPLIVVPLMAWKLPESDLFVKQRILAEAALRGQARERRESVIHALFGERRTIPTLLLWVGYFFTLIVLYLLQNWLPTLTLAKGFSHSATSVVQILFNVGAAFGSIGMGFMMDRGPQRTAVAILYLGLVASMASLASSQSLTGMLLSASIAGMCTVGGQLVLYGLAPAYYHTLIRGTGVGAAVAIGRLGSITGPLVAGQLLSSGYGGATVLTATLPGIVLAALAIELLLFRAHVADV
jgi:MFS transporter, AAHS family, 3-hydroxyphenylpropionic acid transporter